MVFDHAAAFSIRRPFEKLLGNAWGVFLEDNTLTLVHPFFTARLPHSLAYYAYASRRQAFLRVLSRLRVENAQHKQSNHSGRLISLSLHRLVTLR